jgi:hypothetical protein
LFIFRLNIAKLNQIYWFIKIQPIRRELQKYCFLIGCINFCKEIRRTVKLNLFEN